MNSRTWDGHDLLAALFASGHESHTCGVIHPGKFERFFIGQFFFVRQEAEVDALF